MHESNEEQRAPEYRVHSHEAPPPGEIDWSYGDSGMMVVHAIHVKSVNGEHESIDSRKIKSEEFCPECCINDLLGRENAQPLTDEDMKRDYKVSLNQSEDTIFVEKKDGSEFFIFVKHQC